MWPIRDPGSAHGGQARLKSTNSKQHGTHTGPSWNPCRGQAHVKPRLSAHMGPVLDPHGAHHGLTQVGPQQWVQAGRPCWSHIGPTLPTWVPVLTTGQNLLGPMWVPAGHPMWGPLLTHLQPTWGPPLAHLQPTWGPHGVAGWVDYSRTLFTGSGHLWWIRQRKIIYGRPI